MWKGACLFGAEDYQSETLIIFDTLLLQSETYLRQRPTGAALIWEQALIIENLVSLSCCGKKCILNMTNPEISPHHSTFK